MKRVTIVSVACAVVLGLNAAGASADPLDRCNTDATWQVGFFDVPAYAYRTLDASPAGCEEVPTTLRLELLGVRTIGFGSDAFFDTARSLPDHYAGTIEGRTPDTLSATLTGYSPSGWAATEVHTPAGGCGTGCFRTHVSLTVGG